MCHVNMGFDFEQLSIIYFESRSSLLAELLSEVRGKKLPHFTRILNLCPILSNIWNEIPIFTPICHRLEKIHVSIIFL